MDWEALPERIRRLTHVSESGCWLWTRIAPERYAYLKIEGRMRKMPRYVYELANGPIPEGLELDHLCHTPACVNPGHLEPVTHAENMRRSWNLNRTKTHCPQGHPYNDENTIHYVGKKGKSRMCRTCQRQYIRRWKARKREELLAAQS